MHEASDAVMVAKLGGEPVAGPLRRGAADSLPQRRVLRDQPGRAGPGRQGVYRLDQRRADQDAGAVTGSARPAQVVKIGDELDDLGQGEQCRDLPGVMPG